jgi:phosphotransferase system enzyme I (PtsI)
MLPMVTIPDEIVAASSFLDRAMADLVAENVPCSRPPLGIMVEVPAVAIVPELFSAAAFFSIGSNDLTQYITAASRDSSWVAALNDFAHPALRSVIAGIAAHAARTGMALSICGDAASSPIHIPTLLQIGLRSLSVAPAALGQVKVAIAAVDLGNSHAA